MMLSDEDIQRRLGWGTLVIDPYPEDIQFQPASVDLRLGGSFLVGSSYGLGLQPASVHPDGTFYLYPGMFALGTTLETVELSHDLVGQLNGKSTWGRRGLLIHATAGFVDPGFKGQLTLELYNLRQTIIHLTPGEAIAQISFTQLSGPPKRLYGDHSLGSHYQGQQGATPPTS